jgi:hypothetical protein
MKRLVVAIVLAVAGCGPSERELREQTLSTLNVEADTWQGDRNFATTATDAYGRPISATVEKGTFSYTLEIRSHGPDGLPKNGDDIVVTRRKSHGEGTVTGVVVDDIKKGLKLGGEKKP